MYSRSAISQLTRAAIHQGFDAKFFKWEYQANVIKTFESVNSPMKEKVPVSLDGLNMEICRSLVRTRDCQTHREEWWVVSDSNTPPTD